MSADTPAPIVDVHAHLVSPAIEELVTGTAGWKQHAAVNRRRQGEESWREALAMARDRRDLLTDVEARLRAMDAARVDVQVISIASQFHYWAPPGLAKEICLAAHETLTTTCSAAPRRLTGLGMVPLQHPELCAPLLIDALERGLKGVILGSHAETSNGTVELSHPGLREFWAVAEERRATIFLHPLGSPIGERLDRWYLSNIVGQPLEHAVALSHLIFGGVLDRFPQLRLLAAHGGGYLPGYVGRSDHGWRVRSDAHSCERPPSSYLSDMYFDTCVHDQAALRALSDQVGSDRLLMGSDFPYDMGEPDPLGFLRTAQLSDAGITQISSSNASALGLMPCAQD